ncbi:MAG TPA: glycosyltransferase family 2 protein [Thermoleophilaceae bacterium]|nr:glycosyltransferase family 2 protein [Thermoleophilaceae bacterium]
MEAPTHDVSVLTPVLNEAEHIETAARTMLAQEFPGEVEFLFIDGRSEDDTVARLERLREEDPRIRILENPARRTPNGLNVGLAAARGRYVARMDAHTLYPADYLARGVRRLEQGDVSHVSGPQVPEGQGGWSEVAATALGSPLGVGGASFRTADGGEREVDSGFTGVWDRETLHRHGGWDEGWPINQDGELAARIRAEGGRVVCVSDMAAAYVPRNSPKTLARQYWRYGQYRVKTSGRHPTSLRRSHILAPGLALALVASVVPGRLLPQRAARLGVAAYVLVVLTTSLKLARGRPDVAARLAVVFGAMHLPWGFGFLTGCARFGAPVEALSQVLSPGGTRTPPGPAGRTGDGPGSHG